MAAEHHNHAIAKIMLPSGHSIEVLRFSDTAVRELHVCRVCESGLVQPHSWVEADEHHWQITLECPNCGESETGIFAEAEVQALEEELDQGFDSLITDLRRLSHANMADDIERFSDALERNLILPEDF